MLVLAGLFAASSSQAQILNVDGWVNQSPTKKIGNDNFISYIYNSAHAESKKDLKWYLVDQQNCDFDKRIVLSYVYKIPDARIAGNGVMEYWYYTGGLCNGSNGPYQVLYGIKTKTYSYGLISWFNFTNYNQVAYLQCTSFEGRNPPQKTSSYIVSEDEHYPRGRVWYKTSMGPDNIGCMKNDAVLSILNRVTYGNRNSGLKVCREVQPTETYRPDGSVMIPPKYEVCE